jgi:hypothetical protein
MNEYSDALHETIDSLRAENNHLRGEVNIVRDQLSALREYNRQIREQKDSLRKIIECQSREIERITGERDAQAALARELAKARARLAMATFYIVQDADSCFEVVIKEYPVGWIVLGTNEVGQRFALKNGVWVEAGKQPIVTVIYPSADEAFAAWEEEERKSHE